MKKKNISEIIKRKVKNYIKIIGAGALLIAFISPLAQNIIDSTWNSVIDWFYESCSHSIEYQEGFISHLSLIDNSNDTFQDIKQMSQNLPSVLNKGCVLNSLIRNKRNKNIGVTQCSLVVQDIQKIERAKPVFLAYIKNNEMKIVVLNNGNISLPEGSVLIVGEYVDKSGNNKELSKNDFYKMFGTKKIEIAIPALGKGEILEIASWKTNNRNINKWRSDVAFSWLNLYARYTESDTGKKWNDCYMGFLECNRGTPVIQRGQGDAGDYVIKRAAILDIENQYKSPIEKNITTEFYIEAKSDKNVQINILPTSSCVIKFYAEFSAAGERKIKTDTFEQEIEVPIYENESELYSNLIEVIQKNDIKHYEFNSDTYIQDQIEYDPYELTEQIT